eukprot:1159940-Pelagomonas_calceolata.AAC.9
MFCWHGFHRMLEGDMRTILCRWKGVANQKWLMLLCRRGHTHTHAGYGSPQLYFQAEWPQTPKMTNASVQAWTHAHAGYGCPQLYFQAGWPHAPKLTNASVQAWTHAHAGCGRPQLYFQAGWPRSRLGGRDR